MKTLLGQLPNQLNIDGRTLYVAKSTSETAGVISHTTDSILKLIPGFNCGIFITRRLSSSFIIENGSVFIFDSHSRDQNGLSCPAGTSVLLKFNKVTDADNYIKNFYLDHIGGDTNAFQYETQHMTFTLQENDLIELRAYFQRH